MGGNKKCIQRILPISKRFKPSEHYSLGAKLPILKPGLNESH